jgi:hypothetical protein
MILQREIVVDDPSGVAEDPAFAGMLGALIPEDIEERLTLLSGGVVRVQSIRVVRHKPGKRCLIEYGLQSRGKPFRVLGKVRAKGLDWMAYEVQRACREAGLSVPEPLGIVPEYGMWLQRRVPGCDLMATLLDDGYISPSTMRDTADLIFDLHRSDVPATRVHGINDELAILHERLGDLARERPDLSGRIAGLLLAAEQAASRLQPWPRCGIHRDFYPDQVVTGTAGLWLVDLDLYASGDAALDIGNFSGHLIELGVRLGGDPSRFRSEQDAFERRYLERAGAGMRHAVDVYTTLTLARHIQLSTSIPGRRHTTMTLLEICEERFRHACA